MRAPRSNIYALKPTSTISCGVNNDVSYILASLDRGPVECLVNVALPQRECGTVRLAFTAQHLGVNVWLRTAFYHGTAPVEHVLRTLHHAGKELPSVAVQCCRQFE